MVFWLYRLGGSHGAWIFWKWGAVFIVKKIPFWSFLVICVDPEVENLETTPDENPRLRLTVALPFSLEWWILDSLLWIFWPDLPRGTCSIGHSQEEKWELWRRFQVGDSVRAVRAEYGCVWKCCVPLFTQWLISMVNTGSFQVFYGNSMGMISMVILVYP